MSIVAIGESVQNKLE